MSTSKTDIPSSSFSPPPPPFRKLTYDVFLSFRGEDTRKNFTDHLYSALNQRGIFTFRDEEELERGNSIATNLLKAIEESRFAVVIFSRNYANSSWCLDEMAKIVECMKAMRQTVLPVFYEVDPSEVRHLTGDHFGKAFEEHCKAFEDEPEKVRRWRRALFEVSNLPGWHVQDGYDSKVIPDIVQKIFTELNQRFSISESLVGMDSHVDKMLSYLDIGRSDDVRIIGICGMGGIGKTTIAQVVCESVKALFDGVSFLVNIREVTEKQGLVRLQQKLLSNLLKINVNVQNTKMGKAIIRYRLCTKRVLIVLDDVDQDEQLEALCDREWFGPGSRIIITSRDEHLLSAFAVDEVYKVNTLSDAEALQLFCMKAFKKDQLVGEDFLKLSKEFLKHASGLPLAIKVLGSSLYGRRINLWLNVLDKLKQMPQRKVIDVLKVSFDGLQETEKKTFLDIACFFRGEDMDRVIRILEGSDDHCPDSDIEVLREKSMVTLVGRKLWMHDLILELGRQIVRAESPEEPGKRSRLCVPKEIIYVLEKNKGTSALEGITLDFPKTEEVRCDSEVFSNMGRLRVLQIRNVHMMEGPRYLSHKLSILEWSGYPTTSLPQDFNPCSLCELHLCYSSIQHLWSGKKDLPHLRIINVSYSWKLTRTPDLSYSPCLEILILEGCTSLVEIHPSIAFLKRLTCFNLKDCRSLERLPSKIGMECLKILILSGCSKVQRIPDFVGSMQYLLELWLDETAIEQLPISVGLLTGLTLLNLRDCKNLKSLPSDIGKLMSLKSLNICGCSKLETLPDSLGKIECLEKLDATGCTSTGDLPSSISRLKNLEVLSICGCKGMSGKRGRYPRGFLLPITDSGGLRSLTELNLSDCTLQEGTIPEDLGCLSSLLSLNLSKNSFVTLPKSIRQLLKLQNLNLESCKSLKKLPDLSSRISFSVRAEGGNSEARLSSCFNLINCFELVVNQQCNSVAFAMLWRFLQGISYAGNSFETIIPGSEISELFSDQSVGPVVSMQLPRQWHKDKWMGYALCACFVIRRDLPVPANRLGKWKFGTHSTAHGRRCEVKPESLGVAGWCPFFACSQELGQIESEHLWLSFVHGDYFGTTWQEACRNIEFTFKTLGTGMEVRKCGVRLIYQQDLDLIGMK